MSLPDEITVSVPEPVPGGGKVWVCTMCGPCQGGDGTVSIHYDRDGRARCGHPRAADVTTDTAAVTCQTCAALLAGTWSLARARWEWADRKPHGTTAAYRRHFRLGEKPCEPCRQAEARRHADYRAERTAA